MRESPQIGVLFRLNCFRGRCQGRRREAARRWPTSPRTSRSTRPRWSAPTACRSSSRTRRAGRSRRRERTPTSCGRRSVPVYVHAPYLINVCSPQTNVRYGSRKILQQTCDAAAEIGAAGGDRPRRPRRGRDRRGRRPLGAHARDARVRGAGLHREHRRRRQRGRAALRRAREAVGGGRRRRAATSSSASASTPATPTPPARTSPTPSSACGRSSAGSTCCTRTTRATRPGPAPTATRTSARARSVPSRCSAMIRRGRAPVVVETPRNRRPCAPT